MNRLVTDQDTDIVFFSSWIQKFKCYRIIEKVLGTFGIKHAPADVVPRIRMVWNSIPSQLARENKKFVYGLVKQGARAKDFELALAWLMDCGLVHKISRVSKPALPLKAYEDFGAFKLFILDTGLLAAMVNLDVKTLLDGNELFEEFKGALSEQYVLQQLVADKRVSLYYWSAEKSTAEIDFLIQYRDRVIPIEVKAEENLQAKSLRSFVQKYLPKIAIRSSMADVWEKHWENGRKYGIIRLHFVEEVSGWRRRRDKII